MADLAGPISLADQIRLVAGLRWRMLINSLRKKNNVLDLIGMGFVSLFALILMIGPCFAFYFAGYSLVSARRAAMAGGALLGYFYFLAGLPDFRCGFRIGL